jgi:hypothetical protein
MRYDPDFNSVVFASPILKSKGSRLLASAAVGGDPRDRMQDALSQLSGIARELRDILRRAGRDELRVRAHPRDVLELQRFLAGQTRRIALCLMTGVLAIVGALVYLADRNIYVLVTTVVVAVGMFAVLLLLPWHLLSNPLRGYRRWR